jgi:hypothetical protein
VLILMKQKESALIHALIYINVVLVTQLGMFAKRTMSRHVVTSSSGCAPLIFWYFGL